MKKLIGLAVLTIFLAANACSDETGTLKISLTDAPAATNYQNVYIDFGRLEVSNSESGRDDVPWTVINSDGNTIDLLTLNNGLLSELGTADLAPGQYNQVRFYVQSASVVVNGVTKTAQLSSDTIKLVSPFTITEGITTELIVDFDAAHSINYNPAQDEYTITPVTRLVQKDLTGAFKGQVSSPPADVTITVSALKAGEFYSGTTCDAAGNFLLAYMEPGTYTVEIEAIDYQKVTIADQDITAGVVNEYSGSITLIPNP